MLAQVIREYIWAFNRMGGVRIPFGTLICVVSVANNLALFIHEDDLLKSAVEDLKFVDQESDMVLWSDVEAEEKARKNDLEEQLENLRLC